MCSHSFSLPCCAGNIGTENAEGRGAESESDVHDGHSDSDDFRDSPNSSVAASDNGPDELSEDEYEIEDIIEMRRPSGKAMQWLVKWRGWPLNPDDPSSWLLRRDFSTERGYEMLLQFERNRKRKRDEAALPRTKRTDARRQDSNRVEDSSDAEGGEQESDVNEHVQSPSLHPRTRVAPPSSSEGARARPRVVANASSSSSTPAVEAVANQQLSDDDEDDGYALLGRPGRGHARGRGRGRGRATGRGRARPGA